MRVAFTAGGWIVLGSRCFCGVGSSVLVRLPINRCAGEPIVSLAGVLWNSNKAK